MSKKSASQKRALRKQQERAALNNIFNVFLVGLAAEFVLFLIYRCYVVGSVNSLLLWDSILRVTTWVGLAGFLGGIGAAIAKKNNVKVYKMGLIAGLSGLFLFLVSFISTRFFDTGVIALCIAVPVATVLGLVYFLYQRECFLSTALLTATLFVNWLCSTGLGGYWNTLVIVCSLAAVAFLAAVLVLVNKIRKNDGKLGEVQLLSTGCDYRVIFAVGLMCIAAVLLAVLVPSLCFYLTWVLVIALFAELAFYTTKMM